MPAAELNVAAKFGFTVIVPVTFPDPHPPFNGML